MAKLVCQVCKAERDVPVVHCGPGVLTVCGYYLNCPAKGHTERIDLPKHCGKPMKYVELEVSLDLRLPTLVLDALERRGGSGKAHG
ncbi:MAG: hypothetical protein COY46_03605 [Chloroflexi bacterium CG_4_10_14_0_8_um_filter_46_9]|nr:MAG: hypothetical protein AUK39_04580 [Dehalococcoidia bacterium CG2_30_46_19]PIW40009.1 MAG: hypothetical protein COW22_03995 [Chloroflexi bacterium CG15_BIG_FIL_POST_REV_8_21_14_020_46_15]PIZ26744.1 MAG: hypothetical protein COY46_03605 [Chloroflexi bacterium CG_4_10_14_0_8_um_filter_46_9]